MRSDHERTISGWGHHPSGPRLAPDNPSRRQVPGRGDVRGAIRLRPQREDSWTDSDKGALHDVERRPGPDDAGLDHSDGAVLRHPEREAASVQRCDAPGLGRVEVAEESDLVSLIGDALSACAALERDDFRSEHILSS